MGPHYRTTDQVGGSQTHQTHYVLTTIYTDHLLQPLLPRFVQIKFPQQPYNLLRTKFPTPTALDTRSGLSDAGFDLLNRLLTLDPANRITAREALQHKWCAL